MGQWIVIVILVFLIERITPQSPSESEDYPLTKSLGYSIRSGLGKNLDSRFSKEFMEKYKEIRKASQESFENFQKGGKEEKRRRRVIGEDELDLMKEANIQNRRRGPNKLQSAVGRRRARSQALRRDKLNSQSLRSHMHYSKQTNLEYVND